MGHMQNEKQFFVQKQLTKAAFKNFLFYKNILFWLNYDKPFSNLCEGWSKKKGSFPA